MPATVTLIHGFGCDSSFWSPQVAHLASLRWLLRAPDLPYHGGVSAGVAPSLAGLAGRTAEGLRGRAAVLIGHSLGGMIALQIAHVAPELVRGIVLVDSFPDLRLNAQYLPGMFVDGRFAEVRAWVERRREQIVGRMTQATYDTIWPSVRDFNAVPWLSGLRCPVLGVYGGRGRYHGGEGRVLAQELRLNRIAGPTEVRVLPGGGHFVNLEYPRAVSLAIVQWLKQHFGAPVC